MIKLAKVLAAWGKVDFEYTLKNEIEKIDKRQLPLQEALTQSSYVSESNISAVILGVTATDTSISVRSGIFYAGIIAGSCCADDLTPANELAEYCEMRFAINRITAETTVTIVI